MSKVMNMPKIGVNMTEARIVQWLVKEGDMVKEGDHILDAETDKAVQEIYATTSGVLAKILAPEQEDVPCQTPIAIFAEPGESLDMEPNTQVPANEGSVRERIRISPLAKKIARDMHINIAEVKPSKPGARIVKADVEVFLKGRQIDTASRQANHEDRQTGGLPEGKRIRGVLPYTGVRKRIGDKMAQSAQIIPSVPLTLHADAGKLIEWRMRLKAAGEAAGYNDMLVLIAARALSEHPAMNSALTDNGITLLEDIHIGVAVDTEKGLVVPVIRNADKKGLLTISKELRSMAESVKSGKASPEDLTGGTFTITNLGMYEVEQFAPIINYPECCILGVGAIVRQPVAGENDVVEIRPRMQLTLVFDHRIVDGAPAARFLRRVKHLIEQPMDLLN